ncbi:MAG: 50S ribosomal protein L18 [Planctomycetes bacterium]|nr:50S ribosomal protein L18 [Planctomycetota bacterium]
MDSQKDKNQRRLRRKYEIRKTVIGTTERPRLSVFRSNKQIYCQIINDATGATLASASSLCKEAREALKGKGGNRQAAAFVGKLIAERARQAGIAKVVFDRNGYQFHGRVKMLAEEARKSGLFF